MNITPYLSFEGRCEEALAFYHQAVGAETMVLMRYEETPDADRESCPVPEENKRKIMHSSFRVGDTTIFASDGRCSGQAVFQGISLTLQAPDEAAAKKVFSALSEGGQVQVPLAKTFFSPCFGMAVDRYGVSWMVIVSQ